MSVDTRNAGLAFLLSIMIVTSVAFAAVVLKNYIDIAEAQSVMCLVEQKDERVAKLDSYLAAPRSL